jgi:hypothetical protein
MIYLALHYCFSKKLSAMVLREEQAAILNLDVFGYSELVDAC